MKRLLILVLALVVLALLGLPLLVGQLVASQQRASLDGWAEARPELPWHPVQSQRGYGASEYVWQEGSTVIARHQVRHGPLLFGPGRGWASGDLRLEPPLVERSSRVRWWLRLDLSFELEAELEGLPLPDLGQRLDASGLRLEARRIEGARKLRVVARRLALAGAEADQVALHFVAERPGRRALELSAEGLRTATGLVAAGLRFGAEFEPVSDPVRVRAALSATTFGTEATPAGPLRAELALENMPRASLQRIGAARDRGDVEAPERSRLLGALIAELPALAQAGSRLVLSPLRLESSAGVAEGDGRLWLEPPARPVPALSLLQSMVNGQLELAAPASLAEALADTWDRQRGREWLRAQVHDNGALRRENDHYRLRLDLIEGVLRPPG